MKLETYSFTANDLTAFANQVKDQLSPHVENKLDDFVVTIGRPSIFGKFYRKLFGPTAESDTSVSVVVCRAAQKSPNA